MYEKGIAVRQGHCTLRPFQVAEARLDLDGLARNLPDIYILSKDNK